MDFAVRLAGLGLAIGFMSTQALAVVQPAAAPKFNAGQEVSAAVGHIMQNLSVHFVKPPHDGMPARTSVPGAVIASPECYGLVPNPVTDYCFHWVRDAALTVNTLWGVHGAFPQVNPFFPKWVSFEQTVQKSAVGQNGLGLGEPKFEIDGSLFLGAWGRPQNDGPAIRALAYMQMTGRADGLAATDLEYLRTHWWDPTHDLWEEVTGRQFFGTMAAATAFATASQIEARTGQGAQAAKDAALANQIDSAVSSFVDNNRFQVVPTIDYQGGNRGKDSGLDISTILAVLYFGPTPRWSVTEPHILSTASKLEEAFRNLPAWRVNADHPDMAPGIGRYPEDTYDGSSVKSQGNPWFLATFGMGEYHCALVQAYAKQGSMPSQALGLPMLQRLAPASLRARRLAGNLSANDSAFWETLANIQAQGESYLQRAIYHAAPDRHYSEQFDKATGFQRGARDLTWSYSASIRAYSRCADSAKILAQRNAFRR